MHPALNKLRKTVYLTFDKIVQIFGGYNNFNSVYKIASFTGRIRNHIGYVASASKNDYLTAIADSFPELSAPEHRNILAGYWKDHQKMFLELFMYPQMNSDNIDHLVTIDGIENLESALAGGNGAILPVPHIGNIRLLHYTLALKGYPLSVVSSGYTDDPEVVRRFKLKETSKVHDVGFRGDNPKWIIEALKNNRLIQIASTAEAGNAGVEVEFMNRKLFLTSGWVRLAVTTGSPVLPTYIIRGKDNRHRIIIDPPFPLIKGKNRQETIKRTAQAFMAHIEKTCRANPHLIDWMSWHNRLAEAEEHFGNS
ncbi:MAG: lysophospholipid acyltransferase family protein [FCB group bacterium]|nr:lysophospholipid acyltransferase family protein [FCB group bacterium]